MTRSRIILAAAALLSVSIPAFPSEVTDNVWVKGVALAGAASQICDVDEDVMADLGGEMIVKAARSTDLSFEVIGAHAKILSEDIVSKVLANGKEIEFCRNIRNGDWM